MATAQALVDCLPYEILVETVRLLEVLTQVPVNAAVKLQRRRKTLSDEIDELITDSHVQQSLYLRDEVRRLMAEAPDRQPFGTLFRKIGGKWLQIRGTVLF